MIDPSSTSRTYSFKIYDDGKLASVTKTQQGIEDSTTFTKFLNVTASYLQGLVGDFFTYGYFAICSGMNTRNYNSSPYIVVSDSTVDNSEAKEHELVKFLNGFTPNISHAVCGRTIKDSFSLKRSPYSSENLACIRLLFSSIGWERSMFGLFLPVFNFFLPRRVKVGFSQTILLSLESYLMIFEEEFSFIPVS